MSDQEPHYLPDFKDHGGIIYRLATLRLNPSTTATTRAATICPLPVRRTKRGGGASMKRRPSSSRPGFQEFISKKRTHPSSATAATDNQLLGCMYTNLPTTDSHTQAISYPQPENLKSLQETPSAYEAAASSPPRSHFEALTPPPNHLRITPTSLPDSPIPESPSLKRVKRMKDRMREMKQWCEERVGEGEQEANKNVDSPKEEAAVRVERRGECIVINFKCPCGQAYPILLSRNNCYYKLI